MFINKNLTRVFIIIVFLLPLSGGAQVCKDILNVQLPNFITNKDHEVVKQARRVRKLLDESFGKAVTLAEKLMAEHSEVFEVRVLFAEVQVRLYRYEFATQVLGPLIIEDPNDYLVSKLAAESLIALDDPKQALLFLNMALRNGRGTQEVKNMKIETLIVLGQLDEAGILAREIKDYELRSYYISSVFMNKGKTKAYAALSILDGLSGDETLSILWKKAEAEYRIGRYNNAKKLALRIINQSQIHDRIHAVAFLLKIYDRSESEQLRHKILTHVANLSRDLNYEAVQKLSKIDENKFWWFRPIKSEIAKFQTPTMIFRSRNKQ